MRRPQASFPSRSLPPDLQVRPRQCKQLSSTYLTEQSSGLAPVNHPTPASHAATFIGLPQHLHVPAGENSKLSNPLNHFGCAAAFLSRLPFSPFSSRLLFTGPFLIAVARLNARPGSGIVTRVVTGQDFKQKPHSVFLKRNASRGFRPLLGGDFFKIFLKGELHQDLSHHLSEQHMESYVYIYATSTLLR